MSELTRSDIDDILRLIDASDFQELKLEIGDLKLELRKPGAAATPTALPPAPMVPAVAASAPGSVSVAEAPLAPTDDTTAVPAPLLGTFYHAPKPGADPFIKVGDPVTPDTVIGIIEVMKLMNSVTAGLSGTVAAIVAPNGELVEHGQPLIRVRLG